MIKPEEFAAYKEETTKKQKAFREAHQQRKKVRTAVLFGKLFFKKKCYFLSNRRKLRQRQPQRQPQQPRQPRHLFLLKI
jgi:hypothetical protein